MPMASMLAVVDEGAEREGDEGGGRRAVHNKAGGAGVSRGPLLVLEGGSGGTWLCEL